MSDVKLRVRMECGDQVFSVPAGTEVTVDLRPDAPGAKVVMARWGWDRHPVEIELEEQYRP